MKKPPLSDYQIHHMSLCLKERNSAIVYSVLEAQYLAKSLGLTSKTHRIVKSGKLTLLEANNLNLPLQKGERIIKVTNKSLESKPLSFY